MTVMLAFFLLPVFIYVGVRLSAALADCCLKKNRKTKRKIHLIVFFVIFWLYLLPIMLMVFYLLEKFHHLFVFKPSLQWQDYFFFFPFWWGVICVVEIFPYFVLLDIILCLSKIKQFFATRWRIYKLSKYKVRKWLAFLKVGIVLFFCIYVGFRIYFDTYHIEMETRKITIKNLPQEFEGLRLCLIGDIHVNRFTPTKKLEILKKTLQSGQNHLNFFAGDLVSRGIDYIDRALETLCNPKGKIANVACMGDHDYWATPRKIYREMKRCNWKFLQNNHFLISYKSKQILITGITHIYSQKISKEKLEAILANSPPAQLKILIVHQPMEFLLKTAARFGYHLVLAGHTHGGQIVTHVFGFPVNLSLKETGYYSGLYQLDGLKIFVTNGTGQTLAPFRYHAPATIDQLILVKNE